MVRIPDSREAFEKRDFWEQSEIKSKLLLKIFSRVTGALSPETLPYFHQHIHSGEMEKLQRQRMTGTQSDISIISDLLYKIQKSLKSRPTWWQALEQVFQQQGYYGFYLAMNPWEKRPDGVEAAGDVGSSGDGGGDSGNGRDGKGGKGGWSSPQISSVVLQGASSSRDGNSGPVRTPRFSMNTSLADTWKMAEFLQSLCASGSQWRTLANLLGVNLGDQANIIKRSQGDDIHLLLIDQLLQRQGEAVTVGTLVDALLEMGSAGQEIANNMERQGQIMPVEREGSAAGGVDDSFSCNNVQEVTVNNRPLELNLTIAQPTKPNPALKSLQKNKLDNVMNAQLETGLQETTEEKSDPTDEPLAVSDDEQNSLTDAMEGTRGQAELESSDRKPSGDEVESSQASGPKYSLPANAGFNVAKATASSCEHTTKMTATFQERPAKTIGSPQENTAKTIAEPFEEVGTGTLQPLHEETLFNGLQLTEKQPKLPYPISPRIADHARTGLESPQTTINIINITTSSTTCQIGNKNKICSVQDQNQDAGCLELCIPTLTEDQNPNDIKPEPVSFSSSVQIFGMSQRSCWDEESDLSELSPFNYAAHQTEVKTPTEENELTIAEELGDVEQDLEDLVDLRATRGLLNDPPDHTTNTYSNLRGRSGHTDFHPASLDTVELFLNNDLVASTGQEAGENCRSPDGVGSPAGDHENDLHVRQEQQTSMPAWRRILISLRDVLRGLEY